MGGAGPVGADQHLPAGPGAGPVTGQLGERGAGHADVVGGGVGAGVPRPQQDGQRLAAALGAVVDERPQRMVAEPALERRRRLLLLRVGGDQGGVHVDDQRRRGVGAVVGGVLAGQRPHRARAVARAVSIAASAAGASAARASIVRETVGSEATRP